MCTSGIYMHIIVVIQYDKYEDDIMFTSDAIHVRWLY